MGMTRNYNPDLKWETRSTFNIGVDMGLFANRIVMTAEYYTSRTHDMLYEYDVPTPPYPYNKLLANIGKMSNSGFELGMGITPTICATAYITTSCSSASPSSPPTLS